MAYGTYPLCQPVLGGRVESERVYLVRTIGLIPVEKEQPSPFVACAEAQHNRPLDRHSVLPTSVCRPVIMQVFVVAYKFLVSLSGSSSRLQVVVLADV